MYNQIADGPWSRLLPANVDILPGRIYLGVT